VKDIASLDSGIRDVPGESRRLGRQGTLAGLIEKYNRPLTSGYIREPARPGRSERGWRRRAPGENHQEITRTFGVWRRARIKREGYDFPGDKANIVAAYE